MRIEEINKEKIFDGYDFSNKCLIGVYFFNCSFRGCNFSGSDLSYATFERCDLYFSVFSESVLYVTRIVSCDATKADFSQAYLNGFRAKDTDFTKTKFGNSFNTHLERKSITEEIKSENFLIIGIGETIDSIKTTEDKFEGIICSSNHISIKFYPVDSNYWRVWQRKSEIAKTVHKLLSDNGYSEKSLDYYFLYRQFLRKSLRNPLKRMIDYFMGELFWGYGVKIWNPVIAFFINTFFFSLIYSLLPLLAPNSGLSINNNLINIWDGNNIYLAIEDYLQVMYCSFLISSLSVFGSIDVLGVGKLFAVIHVLVSILSLGLGVSAFTKRMANI